MVEEKKCPVSHGSNSQHTLGAMSNQQWWPDQLNLNILHQHDKSLTLWEKTSIIEKSLKNLTMML